MNSIKAFFNSIDSFIPNHGIEEITGDNYDGGDEEINDDNETNEINEHNEHDENNEKINDDQRNTTIRTEKPNLVPVDNDREGEEYDNESIRITNQGLGFSFDEERAHQSSSQEIPPNSIDNESRSIMSMILSSILFIPNLIFIKPLIVFWKILLYPINYLIKMIELDNYQINSKTELIKRENIISNTIKSPTSSSKYMIPPPQRLFPLIRNPQKIRRKILVLDLDETLIHSLSKGSPRTLTNNNSNIIEIKLNDIATLYHVHKRPFCDFFLKEISKWFELHIFTASVKEYADPIIDWLESEIPDSPVFKKRYYRNDCTYRNGVGYIKDLSKFFHIDDLKNVVILDNSPVSYALHEDNAIVIEGWINDLGDKELLNLLPMLQSLSICIDVRFILGLRQGEKVIEHN